MRETVKIFGGEEVITRYFPVVQIKRFVSEIENEELLPGEIINNEGRIRLKKMSYRSD